MICQGDHFLCNNKASRRTPKTSWSVSISRTLLINGVILACLCLPLNFGKPCLVIKRVPHDL
jgi:hypothetical protein